jgi:ABC-type nitrate/sulfonate/bicarbonate transport system permease component
MIGFIRRRLNLPGILFIILLLVVWERYARIAVSPNFPTIEAVAVALIRDAPILAVEAAYTVGRALSGLAIACLIAIPLGVLLGRVRLLGDVMTPVIDLLRPLPPISVAPVAMIFAGTGSAAKIAVIAYGCGFPILITTFDAVRTTQPMLIQVGRSLGLRRFDIMRLIDMPSALPHVLTGVRISLSLSLLISVSTELLLSSNGLGDFISRSQQLFHITDEIAALVLIAILGLAVSGLYATIDRRLLAWHYGRLANGRNP